MGKRGLHFKKAQLELSFSMIFSIIIIIAILAVAFYVITYFLNLSSCTDIGLFYNDLQTRVDKAWASEITQEVVSIKLPTSIKEVCVGQLNGTGVSQYKEEYDFLRRYAILGKNVFLYPSSSACDVKLAYYNLQHSTTDTFFCTPVQGGQVKLKLTKGSFDALVRVSAP